MASTTTQKVFLATLPTELLAEITSYLDIGDFLRLRTTFNRAVVAKTEAQYAKLLSEELGNGVWLSPHTLHTLEAVGKNPCIAPWIDHIDFNVLYLALVNEWHLAISSAQLKPQQPEFEAFVKTQNLFFEHENFEDGLARTLRALPSLSKITTTSTHNLFKDEGIEGLEGLITELQCLMTRYKLEGMHVPYGSAPSTKMELKLFRAVLKADIQLKEASFCAFPVDLLFQPSFFAHIERCLVFGVEDLFDSTGRARSSTFIHFLEAMPRLRTLHLEVGFLKWMHIFSTTPCAVLDWGHPACLTDIEWPVSLQELKIVYLQMLPSTTAFLDTLPKTVQCDIIAAKSEAPSNSLMASEQKYNFCAFG
jgi:hypothetical protein